MAQVVLVTGASRGIGRALVRAFAARGASVLACARSEQGLAETADGAGPGRVLTQVVDVRSAGEVEAAVERAVGEFGRLDVAVANAGLFRTSPLLETTSQMWEEVITTNLGGAFHLCRAAARHMSARDGGGILVQISSVAGRVGFPGSAAYCASKFGMGGLTEAIREELRPHGVQVVLAMPGEVDTAAWDECGLDLDALGLDRARMMRPEDVAETIVQAVCLAPSAVPEEIVLRPRCAG